MAQYSDDNFELVIVLEETQTWGQKPTQADCEALQETEDGTVLIDPDEIMMNIYDMDVKMAAGVANDEGHWETSPADEDSYSNAFMALMDLMGFGNF